MSDTTTLAGLHDFLLGEILARCARPGLRALDLGAGTGALAVRLRQLGWEVIAADRNESAFEADLPFRCLDLNDPEFSRELGEESYGLVTAVEVIEHVESPVGLLRNAGRLLMPDWVLGITTPNVENVPARLRFLTRGKIRMMDEAGEPTHISPIFLDLLVRQYLPLAGLKMIEHHHFPPKSFANSRRRHHWLLKGLAQFLPGECLYGDIHIFV